MPHRIGLALVSVAPQPAGYTPGPVQDDAEVVYTVSERVFRWTWCFLLVLYFLVVLYLGLLAATYTFLYPSPRAAYFTTTFQVLRADKYPVVILSYSLTAFLYLQHCMYFVWLSIRDRRLRFAAKGSVSTVNEHKHSPEQVRGALVKIRMLYRFVFGTTGLLGVRGPFFPTMTLGREVIEMAVLVYQAYQSNRFTASHWANITFGVLIVANCFSTPWIHHYFPMKLGRGRMVVIVVDSVLEVVWFLVIPYMFWAPYAAAWWSEEAIFFQDTFIPKAITEIRNVLVTSYSDLVMKLLPALSLFFSLRKIEYLIVRVPLPTSQRSSRVESLMSRLAQVMGRSTTSRTSIVQALPIGGPRPTRIQSVLAPVEQKKPPSLIVRFLQDSLLQIILSWLLIAIGTFAVVVYTQAYGFYQPKCPNGCKLVLRPWLHSSDDQCRCIVQEINCHSHHLRGHTHELEPILNAIEPEGLLSLIFTHCAALEVPESIHRFHQLFSLDIFNCSISSWPSKAAISEDYFPRFGYLILAYTFLTELPQGILHDSLPESLHEIDIIVSNLTTLPTELTTYWREVRTLYLDYARFTEVPSVLGELPNLDTISLNGNALESLPASAFHDSRLSYINLNQNPLRTVDLASLGDVSQLYQLQLIKTQVPTIDAFVGSDPSTADHSTTSVFADQSPLCDPTAGTASSWFFSTWQLHCESHSALYDGERSLGYYPLEGKLKERKPT